MQVFPTAFDNVVVDIGDGAILKKPSAEKQICDNWTSFLK
jgi:hypothetical protein